MSLDRNLAVLASCRRRLGYKLPPKVEKDVMTISDGYNILLWYGELGDLGHFRDALRTDFFLQIRLDPRINSKNFPLGIISYLDGTALLFVSKEIGDLNEVFLRYYTKFSSTISYITPRDFPIHQVHDLISSIDDSLRPLFSVFAGYFLLGTVNYTPDDFKLLVYEGLFRHSIGTLDHRVAAFATFLLMDALEYRYDVFLEVDEGNANLFIGTTSREGSLQIIKRFHEIVEDVLQSGVKFLPLKSFDEAAALAHYRGYKGFILDSKFYSALPRSSSIETSNEENLEEIEEMVADFRRFLLEETKECPVARETDLQGWSIFSLTALYREEGKCFTLEELEDYRLLTLERTPYVRDYRLWHPYVALGHAPPGDLEDLDLPLYHTTTISVQPTTVYYYLTSTGRKVPIIRVNGERDEEYEDLFRKGYFWSRRMWNLYHEKGIVLEEIPIRKIDELEEKNLALGSLEDALS
jgi:hypothetical protein